MTAPTDSDLAAQVDRLKRRVAELEEALAAAYAKRDYDASHVAGFVIELDDYNPCRTVSGPCCTAKGGA